jgi:hypothetical protein
MTNPELWETTNPDDPSIIPASNLDPYRRIELAAVATILAKAVCEARRSQVTAALNMLVG